MVKVVAYVAVPVIVRCMGHRIKEEVEELYGTGSYVGYDYIIDSEAGIVDTALAIKKQCEIINKIKILR